MGALTVAFFAPRYCMTIGGSGTFAAHVFLASSGRLRRESRPTGQQVRAIVVKIDGLPLAIARCIDRDHAHGRAVRSDTALPSWASSRRQDFPIAKHRDMIPEDPRDQGIGQLLRRQRRPRVIAKT